MTYISAVFCCVILSLCSQPADLVTNVTELNPPNSTSVQTIAASTTSQQPSTTTAKATTANPGYVYLYSKWCAPLNNISPNASAYELLVNNAVRAKCPGYATILPTLYSFWLVDAFGMSNYISITQYMTIGQYIISNNFSVPASVTSDMCNAYVSKRASSVMLAVLTVVGMPPTSPLAGTIPAEAPAFAALLWTPFALGSVALSLLVLKRVRKELDKMPSFIVYQSEIVCQLLSFLSFEYFSLANLSISFAFLAPFCFLSPRVAINVSAVEMTLQNTYYAFWLLGAMLKCAIAFERVVLMYFPVFYHVHITAELVKKIFAVFIAVYFSLTIVVYVAIYAPAFAGQQVYLTNTNGYLIQAPFQIAVVYMTALSVVGVLHVICACLITRKLLSKLKVAAGAGDSRQQMVNRNVASLVVSTTVVSVATYVWMLCQIVVNQCGATCFFSQSALAAFRNTALAAGAALLVDANIAICFVIQCVFSSTYRKAANEAIIQPIRCLCKRIVGGSIVTPVIPVGSAAASSTHRAANSTAAQRSTNAVHSRVVTTAL